MKSRNGRGVGKSQESRLSSHLEGTLKKIENIERMKEKSTPKRLIPYDKIPRLALLACHLSRKLALLERASL